MAFNRIIYSLYDSRYIADRDNALLYTQCNSLDEALKSKKEMFNDAIIVKELVQEKKHKLTVISSTIVS